MRSFEETDRLGAAGEFDDWADFYEQLGVEHSPSELHGLLIGSLAAGQQLNQVDWLRIVMGQVGNVVLEERNQDVRRELEGFYNVWAGLLRNDLTRFEPLLPADDFPLSERLASLSDWCEGFIEGFSGGISASEPELSADTRELLTDLMNITELDTQVEDSDEQEHYYTELVEFLRVAVMNLYAEFNQPPSAPPGTSVH